MAGLRHTPLYDANTAEGQGVSKKLAENGVSRGGLAAAVAAIAAYAVLAFAGAPAAFAAGCARVAATNGSDSAAGTQAQPFRSAQKLVDSLAAGETGCLRSGTYSGNVKVTRSGASGAPITLTSYPGERATVAGKLWITESANFVTVSSLDLDGRNAGNLASPAINGDDVTFVGNDVTNHNTTICFSVGPTTYGRAYRTIIQGNRIHNCGELPATNLDHGIYVEHSTAARIVDNVIYDNADRGVQLYPDAQSSYVARNTIDGNGEGVTIAGGNEDYGAQASNDNVIEQNVITNSVQRYNVESHWGSPVVGQRNVVRQNCVFGGARDGHQPRPLARQRLHELRQPAGRPAVRQPRRQELHAQREQPLPQPGELPRAGRRGGQHRPQRAKLRSPRHDGPAQRTRDRTQAPPPHNPAHPQRQALEEGQVGAR